MNRMHDFDREPQARTSGLAIAGFVIAIVGLALCWFPFLGWIGTVGMIMGIVVIRSRQGDGVPQKKGLAIAAVVMGSVATLGAILWLVVMAMIASSPRKSSCPHLYSHNGQQYVIDADPLSGSLFKGAESTDFDRLEDLVAVNGEYRLKLINERDERDFVDFLSIFWVDHPKGTEVLPTAIGTLMRLGQPAEAKDARDGRGRDIRAALQSADSVLFGSRIEDFSEKVERPRETLTLRFPRPPLAAGESLTLLLRARNTEFGAEAFAKYLATMGTGLSKLLQWAQSDTGYPYKKRLADEMKRLGLMLEVEAWDGKRWKLVHQQQPIGPAVLRSVAIPLSTFDPESDELRIRLRHAPLLWTLDRAAVAAGREVNGNELRPSVMTGDTEELRRLGSIDRERLKLLRNEFVELRFSAPPPPATTMQRTNVLKIRGYYEIDVGGRGLLNLLPLWRHHTGEDSFVRFALELARDKDAS
jgi:hypothetical protein